MRLLVLCFLLVLGTNGGAAEYFVSLSGDDSANGQTEAAAFRTLQKGVDTLQPGDTLTILPGEYLEQVSRKKLGSADAVTTLRAKIPGTVVLRGDVPLSGFEPADGLHDVYVAPYKGPLEGVNERDTYVGFLQQPGPADLQFRRAAFHYDTEAGKLYLSSSDFRPAGAHRYSVATLGGHGLYLEEPVRVVIDGLCATGFRSAKEMSHRSQYAAYGIFLDGATRCVIRNSRAWLNEGGIGIRSTKGTAENVIEDCIAYGNASGGSTEGGNILIFSPQADVIRRCVAYHSWRHGIRLYGRGGHSSAIEDSVAWGNGVDMFLKGENDIGVLRRSVAWGTGHASLVDHSLIGGHNHYISPGQTPRDTVPNARLRLKWDTEFADPVNFDFRLQSTSTLRTSGPEKKHRGPYAMSDEVRFVRPEGDDAADGRSVAAAWKTLAYAATQLKPGQTLYLSPGTYAGDLTLATGRITLAGRGEGQVKLEGKVSLDNANGVVLRRLDFAQTVRLKGSDAVEFENCRFHGEETGLVVNGGSGLRVVHGEFTGFTKAGLRLEDAVGAYLESNYFANRAAPALAISGKEGALLYSDYNRYANDKQAWKVGKTTRSLTEIAEKGSERYATTGEPGPEGRAAGAHGEGAGFHQDIYREEIVITPPKVFSTSATTANVEWKSSHDAVFTLAWGKTPECADGTARYELDPVSGAYVTYSLTGLEPGASLYFQIRSVEPRPILGVRQKPYDLPGAVTAPIKIQTAAIEAPPREWHVANGGDDTADGKTRESALRTIQAAADRAQPGDTVVIHGGEYVECVFVRVTGEKGRPITFRNAPGERVRFASAGKQLTSAWVIRGKKGIALDGFAFGQFGPSGGGGDKRLINVYASEAISITRCLSDQRGPGYSSAFLRVEDSRDVRIANCVTYNGFDGFYAQGVDDLVFEHNVIARPLTVGTQISATKGGRVIVRNNIFVDSQPYKAEAGVHYHEWGGYPGIVDENNVYFLALPDAKRRFYWLLNYTDGKSEPAHTRMDMARYQAAVPRGRGRSSIIADPLFAGMSRTKPAGLSPRNQLELLFPFGRVDFDTFFATAPEVVERGAGLQREAFSEFTFPETFEEPAGKSMSLK